MAAFLYQTKGGTTPDRKPRVYFTCHPNDFEITFGRVCDDILGVCDCAIYYTEKMEARISNEDKELGLKRMNLFVVPVTRNLLSTANRAIDVDLAYAKENGIPVLPMVFESGLVSLYSQNDILGELQYLDPFSVDPTELSYEEKLKSFIKTVLISDDLANRIRNEFDGYIFLSYRKKDRYFANQLMRLIHDKPECRDLAIWFDEYLIPGRRFKENIFEMLDRSKIFALLVTPSILEEPDGNPNFVMGVEYKEALDRREKGMVILPAEMVETDKTELAVKFDGLPECVNPNEYILFGERLHEAILKAKVIIRANDDIPEHNYLIGLAYRDGIDVEVNRERGLSMIEDAANAGLPAAAKELAAMYYYGFCVHRSNSIAQKWQRKLIDNLRRQLETNPSANTRMSLIDALRFYAEIARNGAGGCQTAEVLIDCCTEALELCNSVQCTNDSDRSWLIESKLNTIRSLAIAYETAGQLDAALATYQNAMELRKVVQELDAATESEDVLILNKWRIAQIHHDIGILHERRGDHSVAVNELEKALKVYEEIVKSSVKYIPNMIAVHHAIASNAIHIDIDKAIRHSDTALSLSKSLFDALPMAFDLLYAKNLYLKAFILSEIGQLEDVEAICIKAKEILEAHADDGAYETLSFLMSVFHKLAGVCIINRQWEKAEALYRDGVAISTKLVNSTDAACREAIAHLYFDYGTLLRFQASRDSMQLAKDYLQKALELFAEVSYTKASCQMYVIETELALRELNKSTILGSAQSPKRESSNIDSAVADAGMRYIRHFSEGEKAERAHQFDKALLRYKLALQEIEQFEDKCSAIANLDLADLYDRIAVCCEMQGDYVGAKENYAQACLVSSNEARETKNVDAFSTAIAYVHKLVSFCEEFGDPEEAEVHRQFCAFLEDEMAQISLATSPRSNALKTVLDETVDKEVHSTETDGDITRDLESLFDDLFGPSADDDFYIGSDSEKQEIETRFNELFGFDDETVAAAEDPTLISLTDEKGQEVYFTFADLINYRGNEYVVLIPMTDNEVVILRAIPEMGDKVSYLPVEDEGLLAILFEIFRERNKNRFNFTE